MDEVFIDTAGWAVLFVRTEPQHAQASVLFQQWKRQGRRLLTTNYILTELVSLFISPLCVPRPAQFRYIDTVKAVAYVEIVHVDPALDTAGWALLKSRPNKEWSLIAADYDAERRLAGIEILDALKRVGDPQTLRQVILEDVGLVRT